MKIGIAGYGLLGRLLAYELLRHGHQVTAFDFDVTGNASAAMVAAGMICPYSEIDLPKLYVSSGTQSIEFWHALNQQFGDGQWFNNKGSIVFAHAQDQHCTANFKQRFSSKSVTNQYHHLTQEKLRNLGVNGEVENALFFPDEAAIDAPLFLTEIDKVIRGFEFFDLYQTKVTGISPRLIMDQNNKQYCFDWTIDCRGMGAKDNFRTLRGIRGEVIHLHAPQVHLLCPVRLLHPRYHLYIVPRKDHHFIIGASEIESEDCGPITVRTTLELLSAAFSVSSKFSEAKIIKTATGLRPTLPSHLPEIKATEGLISINGLYRHGFLLSPIMVKKVINKILGASF